MASLRNLAISVFAGTARPTRRAVLATPATTITAPTGSRPHVTNPTDLDRCNAPDRTRPARCPDRPATGPSTRCRGELAHRGEGSEPGRSRSRRQGAVPTWPAGIWSTCGTSTVATSTPTARDLRPEGSGGKFRRKAGTPADGLRDRHPERQDATSVPQQARYRRRQGIVGRKRSIVTDTLGLLLTVLVTAAGVQDSVAGPHCSTRSPPTTRASARYRSTVDTTDTPSTMPPLSASTWRLAAAEPGAGASPRSRSGGRSSVPTAGSCSTAAWPATTKVPAPRSEAVIHIPMTDLMARRLTSENTISWRDPEENTEHAIPG